MTDLDWSIEAYDYELPQELIAQNPVVPRDSSRLMVIESLTHNHRIFRDLPDLLQPEDLLVLNNTRVIPARLYGQKTSGAQVEILLLKQITNDSWLAWSSLANILVLGQGLSLNLIHHLLVIISCRQQY